MLRIVIERLTKHLESAYTNCFTPPTWNSQQKIQQKQKEQKTAPWNARFPAHTSNHSINFKMCHLYRLVIWASIGSLILPNFKTPNSAFSLFWTLTPLNISSLLHGCNHRAQCTGSPSHLARKTPPNSWMAPRCRVWPVACDMPDTSRQCMIDAAVHYHFISETRRSWSFGFHGAMKLSCRFWGAVPSGSGRVAQAVPSGPVTPKSALRLSSFLGRPAWKMCKKNQESTFLFGCHSDVWVQREHLRLPQHSLEFWILQVKSSKLGPMKACTRDKKIAKGAFMMPSMVLLTCERCSSVNSSFALVLQRLFTTWSLWIQFLLRNSQILSHGRNQQLDSYKQAT